LQGKSDIQQGEDFFRQQILLKLKEGRLEFYIWSIAFILLKLGHFGQLIINSLKFVKCGVGDE